MATLAGLPTEVLLLVSDFLLPVDLGCFSLCNHRLYSLFSRQKNCATAPDKFSVLTRLERDIPPYFACNSCILLHRYDGSKSFGLSGYFANGTCPLPCAYPFEGWFSVENLLSDHEHEFYCLQHISFLQVKLALRRFYYGPESGISTASLSYTQVQERYWRRLTFEAWLRYIKRAKPHNNDDARLRDHNQVLCLTSREAQICTKPLGLYFRVQDIILSSEWRELIDRTDPIYCDPLALCPHHTNRRNIAHILKSPDEKEKGWAEIAGSCNICNTVYAIELCEHDSEEALIITKWFNLGPGLDMEDPLWTTHTSTLNAPRNSFSGYDANYSIEAQSPRERFEETAPRSFKDLRFQNLSMYLKDRQYRKTMRYSHLWDTWYSPFSELSTDRIDQRVSTDIAREPSTSRIINFWRSILRYLGIVPDAVSD